MSIVTNFALTNVYDQGGLLYPAAGPVVQTFIPIKYTKIDGATTNPTVPQVQTGPIIDLASNTGAGGVSVGYGVAQLPRLVIEGWIDTPYATDSSGNIIPSINISGIAMSYPEIIAMYYEGRVTITGNNQPWARINPLWYRDPYGRQYNSPKVLAFQAQRVASVPFRHNIQLTLLVGGIG